MILFGMAKNMGKNDAVNSSYLHNVIAAASKVEGNIVAEEDIRIDGVINGNITCKGKVIIGPLSNVTGDIECSNLDLLGKVTGNVICTETIALKSTSSLIGDIKAKAIEIEPGAFFTGSCSMNNKQNKLQ